MVRRIPGQAAQPPLLHPLVDHHLIRYQLTLDSGEPVSEFWEETLRNAVLTVLNVDQYGNLTWGCYGEGSCCCAELVANA